MAARNSMELETEITVNHITIYYDAVQLADNNLNGNYTRDIKNMLSINNQIFKCIYIVPISPCSLKVFLL